MNVVVVVDRNRTIKTYAHAVVRYIEAHINSRRVIRRYSLVHLISRELALAVTATVIGLLVVF